MGRDTWFYKVDKYKAKKHLVPFLEESSFNGITFRAFLEERNELNEQYNQTVTSFDDILNCIDSDFNQIKASALNEVIRYLKNFNYAKNDGKNKFDVLTNFGIEEFFYARNGYGIMWQISNYTDEFDIELQYEDDDGIRIEVDNFISIANYLMLLGELMDVDSLEENEQPEFHKEVFTDLETIKKYFRENKRLWDFLTKEFEDIKYEYLNELEFGSTYKAHPYVDLYYKGYGILHSFFYVKKSLANKNTHIIIVDSI